MTKTRKPRYTIQRLAILNDYSSVSGGFCGLRGG